MDYSDNMTEPDRPEFDERAMLGAKQIVGSKLAGSKREAPLSVAFTEQDKALSLLADEVNYLQEKLRPISSSADTTDNERGVDPRPPVSDVVRVIHDNNDRIVNLSRRLRYMREMLEV